MSRQFTNRMLRISEFEAAGRAALVENKPAKAQYRFKSALELRNGRMPGKPHAALGIGSTQHVAYQMDAATQDPPQIRRKSKGLDFRTGLAGYRKSSQSS